MGEDDVGVDCISRSVEFLINESDFLLLLGSQETFFVGLACVVRGLLAPP